MTITRGLFVRLEAKPGKEQAAADFLAAGLELTNREATTPIWFALQLSPRRSASSTPLRTKRIARRISLATWQRP
jgi:hypothetical protein